MIPLITTPRLMAVGGGAVAELPGMLRRLGLANPLIVTDPFIERSGHLERATEYLDHAGISWMVFSDTVADPTTAVVEAGTRRLAEGNFDSLVAIGGGSSIDTAKGMSVLAANGGRMRDYKVPAEIPQAGPPIVAIPTTAGTGSEVTRFTVITDTETDEKMLIAGLACCPLAAIVDYELTLTMPLRLTAVLQSLSAAGRSWPSHRHRAGHPQIRRNSATPRWDHTSQQRKNQLNRSYLRRLRQCDREVPCHKKRRHLPRRAIPALGGCELRGQRAKRGSEIGRTDQFYGRHQLAVLEKD